MLKTKLSSRLLSSIHCAASSSTVASFKDAEEEDNKNLKAGEEFLVAKRVNLVGKISVMLLMVVFNMLFWSVALKKYFGEHNQIHEKR